MVIIIIRIGIKGIIRIIDCSGRTRDTADAAFTERMTAWQGLWLVEDETTYWALHGVLDAS